MLGNQANHTIKAKTGALAQQSLVSTCNFNVRHIFYINIYLYKLINTTIVNDLQLQSPEQHIVANLPNRLCHTLLVNMTDTDSFGAPRPP